MQDELDLEDNYESHLTPGKNQNNNYSAVGREDNKDYN